MRNSTPKSISLSHGGKAQVRANGQLRSVDKNGMHIEHNLHGGRTTVSEKNGKRVVTNGKHGGYVQRPLTTRNGHSYYARTSYDHGVARSGVYRGYAYGGHVYYGYQPAAYFSASFYGWAGNPWAGRIAWDAGAWGWAGAPWLGYYGFSPYGVYPGPAFWLTDYLIAANLQAAYAGLGGDGINVIANQPWNDTGMQVVQGQTYIMTASGVINYSGGNPSTVATPAGIGGPDANTIAPALPSMSLVGKVGPDGAPFFVGVRRRVVAPADGELFLSVNDSNFPDNSGSWAVSVSPLGGRAVVAGGGMPVRIVENENSSVYATDFGGDSPVWNFSGMRGTGQFGTGLQPMTVEKFDGGNIIVRRRDTSGNWRGSALYVGQIQGDIITGQVTYFDPNGGTRNGGWHGRIDGWSAPAVEGEAAAPAATASSDPAVLTPEAKSAIADEVKAQIGAEKDAAGATVQNSNDVPPALDPARRNFVVSADLAVTTIGDNQECSLTGGDVITRLTDTPDADQKVNASVTSAKKSDCAAGKLVAVSVDDLQEMRNHFQETLDAGLKTMAAKQGTHGMPKAPSTATVANSIQAPPPDASAAEDLQAQQQAADQTEAEAKNEATSGAGGQQ